jgi:hypothetical protein
MTEKWSRKGAEAWGEATAIAGTLAEVYLRGRGISKLPGPEVLRFHPAVEHPKLQRKFPALIAKVSGAAEASHNVTWLAEDGKGKAKIDRKEQRRTLGASKGGAVHLAEPVEGQWLLVGEGPETTLSVMEATGLPGWATLGTSGLTNIEIPVGVSEIILLAENDNGANQRALNKACPTLVEKGLKVRVAPPPAGRKDFNDLVDPARGGSPAGLAIAKAIIGAAPEWRPDDEDAEKPRLKIDRSHPERTVADLRNIFAQSERLYERGTPVRVVFDESVGGSVAHELATDSLLLEAHFACQPYVMVREKKELIERDAPLPPQVARMYLGWKGEWALPPLNGVTTTPLLGDDGSIRSVLGYDTATGLWCDRTPNVGPFVRLQPTRAEAEAALLLVRDAFKTFCFADSQKVKVGETMVVDLRQRPGVDESSFLTSLLGSVCRASLWLAPGALFRAAPHSGSGAGKGKLVRCVCAVAYGRQPSAVTAGGGPEEMEKRISSALLEGGPAVLFDNFNNITLRSAALESALTERPAKVRQFRTLELVALNALASVFVTGNGVLLAHDLVRRFIPTEFDAGMEDPEQREFAGDIVAEIAARRSELLAALLTIWRWGRQNTDLKRGIVLGSYEQWCSWVRDPLLDLGCQDPITRMIATKQRDPFRQTVAAMFAAWWKHHGSSPMKAHELDVEIQRIIDPQGRGRQFVAAGLEKMTGTRLGGFLLTRQESMGKWSAATYALTQTDDPHAPYAFSLGGGEKGENENCENEKHEIHPPGGRRHWGHRGHAEAALGVNGSQNDGSSANLVKAITAYAAGHSWWRGPPNALFTAIGQPADEADGGEAAMIDQLNEIKGALAEGGIAMEISGGYVTMTRIEQKSVKTPATPNESNGMKNPQKSANPNEPRVGEPNSLEVAPATSVWIQNNDPCWSKVAALGRANGSPIRATRAPPNHPTARGYGAWVPASWLTRS